MAGSSKKSAEVSKVTEDTSGIGTLSERSASSSNEHTRRLRFDSGEFNSDYSDFHDNQKTDFANAEKNIPKVFTLTGIEHKRLLKPRRYRCDSDGSLVDSDSGKLVIATSESSDAQIKSNPAQQEKPTSYIFTPGVPGFTSRYGSIARNAAREPNLISNLTTSTETGTTDDSGRLEEDSDDSSPKLVIDIPDDSAEGVPTPAKVEIDDGKKAAIPIPENVTVNVTKPVDYNPQGKEMASVLRDMLPWGWSVYQENDILKVSYPRLQYTTGCDVEILYPTSLQIYINDVLLRESDEIFKSIPVPKLRDGFISKDYIILLMHYLVSNGFGGLMKYFKQAKRQREAKKQKKNPRRSTGPKPGPSRFP